MAQIEIRRSFGGLPTSSGAPRAGYTRSTAGESIVAGLGSIAGVIKEINDENKKKLDNEYIVKTNMSTTEQIYKMDTELKKGLNSFEGYSDSYIKQVDKIYKDALDNAPSDSARAKLAETFANRRNSFLIDSIKTETRVIEEQVKITALESASTIAAEIFSDPDSFEVRSAQLEQLLIDARGSFEFKADYDKFKHEATSAVMDSTVRGYIAKGELSAAEHLIKNPDFGKYLSPAYKGSILEGIRKEKEAKANEAARITAVHNVLQSGEVLDVDDSGVKRELDNYYEKFVMPNLDPENPLEGVQEFIQQSNYVPSKVESNLKASLYNGSNQDTVNSAMMLRNLMKDNPHMMRQFTAELPRVQKITADLEAGVKIEDAVKAANNMLIQKGSPEYEFRKDRYERELELEPNKDTASWYNFFSDAPSDIPEGMRSDYKQLVKTYYVDNNMSEDKAVEAAQLVIDSRWGSTKINSDEPEYMRHAPELYYNARGIDPSWMRSQLDEEVAPLLPEDHTGYRIEYNRNTKNPKKPDYTVWWTDKHGSPMPLLDKEGKVLLWRPDANSSKEAMDNIKEREKEAVVKRILKGSKRPETLEEIESLLGKIDAAKGDVDAAYTRE